MLGMCGWEGRWVEMINGKAKWNRYEAVISYEIFLHMIPLSFRTFL